MKQFTHPDTGNVYTLEDHVRHFYVYDDFPKNVGQKINYESFDLVDGVWQRGAKGTITVDKEDLKQDALLDIGYDTN